MKVRFLKLADQELTDVVTWYNQQTDGLGRDFLDDMDRGIRRMAAFPVAHLHRQPRYWADRYNS